jgi:pantoate--beta-alanine ligase
LRAAKFLVKEGERNAAKLEAIVRKTIETEPLAQIDYVAVVDNETLEPIEKIGENAVLIAVAVRFGKTRLIDNTVINRKQ